MGASSGKRRQRGTIRRRGNSLQVIVYAGIDPLTGERMYLRESTTDPAEAERIRTKFLSQVDDGRNAKTRATLGAVLESWLRWGVVGRTRAGAGRPGRGGGERTMSDWMCRHDR